MEKWWANALWSLTPSVIIGAFFWFVIRAISRADRTERRVYKQIEDEERAKAGLPPKQQPSAVAETGPAEEPPQ
ncbi:MULTISPECIES: hypothetical protein [Leucobacter]|uniref:Uncharacterized protein n=1 Tax=Leucobacter chromiiresistens TaxID=1079994 RepID=A0A1H0YHQ0_9MICO|nr:hypothetical protein [Leucobacter chromiiresistens]SDQ14628.1 hypothetical protein SAMN04488565_0880 [Leucobacter chromiiresistens]